MKLSAKILFIAGIILALGELIFPMGTRTATLLIVSGAIAILDFVFMLKSETNKKLLWIHIIPLAIIMAELLYDSFRMGFMSTFFGLSFLIAANTLIFCALLVHIDHSIKQQRIKDLEAEIAQLKG